MKKLLLSLLLCSAVGSALAKIELPSVVGSNMVLQQNSDAALWGKAKANAVVSVTTSWNGAKKTTKADANGAWLLKVATPSWGGPYSITISDGQAITLDNVLIGEVWICSGQSNMEMSVLGFGNQPIDGSTQAIMNGAAQKSIRMFKVARGTSATELDNCKGEWAVSTPKSVAAASATAYFFALNLTRALDGVPVGIVMTSWGGTAIQPWMPTARSEKVMDEQYLKKNPTEQYEHRRMGYLYNAMIAPLRNFTARGFLWYQGEANIGNNRLCSNGLPVYTNLMAELVDQWRSDWGDKSNQMPFYYVELAPYNYNNPNDTGRPMLVEAQIEALKVIPNSGIAATIDIGNPICIHPAQKDKVGERLALLALANTYDIMKDQPVTAPLFKSVSYKDGKALVEFTPSTCGLNSPTPKDIIGFEIAGENGEFRPGTAAIVNNSTVTVSCPEVADPKAVRYGFRNYVEVNLFNAMGIPAMSFRTDK